MLARPLPVVKQDSGGKCGPSSLAIALAYFGRIIQSDPYDFCQLSNFMTHQVYAVAQQNYSAAAVAHLGPSTAFGATLSSGQNLVETARLYGLYAETGQANFAEIRAWVSRQQVVLIHWQVDLLNPMDQHWSALQAIHPLFLELRDPWPTHPSANYKSMPDFLSRSTVGQFGRFTYVRISDQPL